MRTDDQGDHHQTTEFIETSPPSQQQHEDEPTEATTGACGDQDANENSKMLPPSAKFVSMTTCEAGERLLSADRVIVELDGKDKKRQQQQQAANNDALVPDEQVRDAGPHGYKNWLLRINSSVKNEYKIAIVVALAILTVVLVICFIDRTSSSSSSSGKGTSSSSVFNTLSTTDGSIDTIVATTTSGEVLTSSTKKTPPDNKGSSSDVSTAFDDVANKAKIVNNSVIISSTMQFPVTTAEPVDDVKYNATTGMKTDKTTTTTKKNKKKKDETSDDDDDVTVATEDDVTSTTPFPPTSTKKSDAASTQLDEMMYTTTRTGEMFDMTRFIEENNGKMNYMVGVGRGDITGPAAEVNMMGYANMDQQVNGIHTRLYARTFMIGDKTSNKPFLFINTDACMGASLLKLELLKKLQAVYGDLFTGDNICLTGTHTHSAPAGFLQDVLFQITSKGYIPQTLDTMVHGIMMSVKQAHASYAPGWIFMNKGELLNTNINRSPTAYVSNPLKERMLYKYSVDKEMTLIKFVNADGKGIGMINWFPVHCTSMNNTNTLISSDNKGYAELLFERAMDPGSLAGESKFVAAFAQSHEGDVSPNIRGARCIDTGRPCNAVESSCDGSVSKCIASGPGKDMFDSTKIIGRNQYVKAMELYDSAQDKLEGPVSFIKQNINMTEQVVKQGNKTYHTCQPAMGYSFAAGTTDGPGVFDFKQGKLGQQQSGKINFLPERDTKGNAFWNVISKMLKTASKKQKDCHAPKPILVDSGEMTKPYEWQPKVVETQIMRIGNLIINAIPAEFTTMSGRRLMKAVREVLKKHIPDEEFEIVIAGLSNAYSDYVTTYEEYQVQRYEGASTIYGPYTLQAYIQQYQKMTDAIVKGEKLPPGPEIHNMRHRLLSLQMGVVYDRVPLGMDYGELYVKANDKYHVGEEVMVEFVTGHPKNSYGENIEKMNFLAVERLVNTTWVTVHTDADWCTKFVWSRERSTFGDTSEAKIYWVIPLSTPEGSYRIQHFGHRKLFVTGNVYNFQGTSNVFKVLPSPPPSRL